VSAHEPVRSPAPVWLTGAAWKPLVPTASHPSVRHRQRWIYLINDGSLLVLRLGSRGWCLRRASYERQIAKNQIANIASIPAIGNQTMSRSDIGVPADAAAVPITALTIWQDAFDVMLRPPSEVFQQRCCDG